MATDTLNPSTTIADLGEQRLLALLQSFCPATVVGDDAALLTPQPGYQLVVTTDVLVDGVHFSDHTTPAHAAGWRAVAANLSDLAAMGASGLGITVGLSLPPSCPVTWVTQLYQGMVDCLAPYGLAIVGGDVCRAEQRAIAITALGQVKPGQAWQRHTANVGDAIVVSGSHGGSRAGLSLLLEDQFSHSHLSKLTPPQKAALIQKHQYPCPRLNWPPHLTQLPDTITAMDSSDGLADAILQICRASQVGATLAATAIPVPDSLTALPELALHWALYGGEDFELVLCLPPQQAQQLCSTIASDLNQPRIIGQITAESKVELVQTEGSNHILTMEQGFQHFTTECSLHQQ